MKCPNDEATLVMSERSGVEIDYCPQCRGVWLDRGELDKILDRAQTEMGAGAAAAPPAAAPAPQGYAATPFPPAPVPRYDGRDDQYRDRDRGYGNNQPYGYRKKKDNWLSELFD